MIEWPVLYQPKWPLENGIERWMPLARCILCSKCLSMALKAYLPEKLDQIGAEYIAAVHYTPGACNGCGEHIQLGVYTEMDRKEYKRARQAMYDRRMKEAQDRKKGIVPNKPIGPKGPCLWHTFWVGREMSVHQIGHVCYKECGVFWAPLRHLHDKNKQVSYGFLCWFCELPVGATLWLYDQRDAYVFFGLELGIDVGDPSRGLISHSNVDTHNGISGWTSMYLRLYRFYYVLDFHIAAAARELGYQYIVYTRNNTVVQL